MKKYIAPATKVFMLDPEASIMINMSDTEGWEGELSNKRRGGGSAIWSSDTEDSSKPFNRK